MGKLRARARGLLTKGPEQLPCSTVQGSDSPPALGWSIPLPGDRSTAHPGPLSLLWVIPVAEPPGARVARGASARLSWAAGSSAAPNQLFG